MADHDVQPEFSLFHAAPPAAAVAGRPASARPVSGRPVPARPAQHQGQQGQQGQRPPSAPYGQPAQRAQQGQQAAQQVQQRSSFSRSAAAAAQQAPQPSPPSAPQSPAQAAPMPILPPDHWPPQWQQRLQATRPAPVIWTYWALGQDLCVEPNAARRDLLRRMLGALAHPAGTHSFWPVALPGENGLEANAQIFWSGVHMLQARAILFIGSPAVSAL